jgi:urease gamma subunit
MYLSPTEIDRLQIFVTAEMARRALERGLRLNAPEVTALICDEMHLAARSGDSYERVVDAGRRAVREHQLIEGVAELVDEIRVEVLLEEGTKLIVLRRPWG